MNEKDGPCLDHERNEQMTSPVDVTPMTEHAIIVRESRSLEIGSEGSRRLFD